MQHVPFIRIAEKADTAVLMIHGIVGSPCHFAPLLSLIPESWSVYNILLDGHGGTVEDFAHTSMEKWKHQVQAQLDEILLTHRRVLIIGHSMGTLFAIQQAIRCPEQVFGLFLLNVPLAPYLHPVTGINSMLLALGFSPKSVSAQGMRQTGGVTLSPKLWKYLSWTPRFLELFREVRATKQLLPQLKTPTLAFHSRRDELVLQQAQKYTKDHPYITNILLETSGHFSYSREDLEILQSKLSQLIEDHI